MTPKTVHKEVLLAALRDMYDSLLNDDSFEGSLEYTAAAERHQFEVMAFYRIGNSEGQGRCRMIGETS